MSMLFPTVEEFSGGVRVSTPSWTVEHRRSSGGAWSSLKIHPDQELLRQPAGSSLRFVSPDLREEQAACATFSECLDTQARLSIEQSPSGAPVIVAEGVYRDKKGQTVPVGFRRRTEYLQHGLIWSTLDIMSDSGCDGVIEVKALSLSLRAGLSDAFVRFHPSQAGGSDLLGGQGWFDLRKSGTAFLSRFTPLQVLLKTEDAHRIELFPGSDLAQWDCSVKPDAGLGYYAIQQDEAGTTVELSPYCLAFRRITTRVQGRLTFKLGFGLPELQAGGSTGGQATSINSLKISPNDFADLTQSGVKVLRFEDNYRESGPFWRSGSYPPYDESDMAELRRDITAAQQQGLKIVPRISLREFHPDAPGFSEQTPHWNHQAAPSLGLIHRWVGSGESGALMCLKSGWLDWSKRNVYTLLKDIPWNGLYLDDCTFYPCCHLEHTRVAEHSCGPFHSDVEEFLEFLFFCRERVDENENGTLLLNLTHRPSIVAQNVGHSIDNVGSS